MLEVPRCPEHGLAQDAGGDHRARPLKRDGWRGETGPSMGPQPHQQGLVLPFITTYSQRKTLKVSLLLIRAGDSLLTLRKHICKFPRRGPGYHFGYIIKFWLKKKKRLLSNSDKTEHKPSFVRCQDKLYFPRNYNENERNMHLSAVFLLY